ncbi:hypothetical protein EAO82_15445 [Halopseudomonas pelagia]|uniref:Uncharacterized protein n=1 Tax=Halopseudomonas pelagia TaxID=553151 RepID=A0AA91Z6J4_9GAMM|nr:hypothetical protein CO192_07680 [Halopseudomonas pelagia]QFY57638.1 hypothetical protein EAO82_15445 [Halopseudomonas pelagia]
MLCVARALIFRVAGLNLLYELFNVMVSFSSAFSVAHVCATGFGYLGEQLPDCGIGVLTGSSS